MSNIRYQLLSSAINRFQPSIIIILGQYLFYKNLGKFDLLQPRMYIILVWYRLTDYDKGSILTFFDIDHVSGIIVKVLHQTISVYLAYLHSERFVILFQQGVHFKYSSLALVSFS